MEIVHFFLWLPPQVQTLPAAFKHKTWIFLISKKKRWIPLQHLSKKSQFEIALEFKSLAPFKGNPTAKKIIAIGNLLLCLALLKLAKIWPHQVPWQLRFWLDFQRNLDTWEGPFSIVAKLTVFFAA